MASPIDLAGLNKTKLHLGDFAQNFYREATPFGSVFSYYAAAVPFAAEDLRDFVDDPIAALPPRILAGVGKVVLLFVPYLERPAAAPSGKRHAAEKAPAAFDPRESLVAMDAPAAADRLAVAYLPPSADGEPHIFAFGIQGVDASDFHYSFFHAIAQLVLRTQPDSSFVAYRNLLREELKSRAHGEVDDEAWKAKLALLKKESGLRGESKLFLEYARNSMVDTLTLFLHGICCDIDVEPGPRQIASRYLRKRLQLLQAEFPQPEGYAVFPEELKN
ncbi:MAG TPA: hypothetical protein VFQ91_15640 [Bryobacteraceae bacterium]|nr:hypothetical protein [Bryobacteraceae bacterium]